VVSAAAKKTVLVVDDDSVVRKLVRAVLLRQGYEVLEAEDGVEAYELLQQLSGGIHLLIADVQMPRMNGITLSQKVSAEYPAVRILCISGFVSDPPERLPSPHFLEKPFAPAALVRYVQNLCS
jgi:two-component system, cell cycle sensor histidine kinase and response regulator CckA